jgi:hypothetical protein
MLPALIATWLPNHDNGGMRKGFFHSFPFSKGDFKPAAYLKISS